MATWLPSLGQFAGGCFQQTSFESWEHWRSPPVLRELAQLFTDVQDQRHFADYDLATGFFRNRILDLIDDVERNIRDWDTIRNTPAARFFLVGLLVWDKVRNK